MFSGSATACNNVKILSYFGLEIGTRSKQRAAFTNANDKSSRLAFFFKMFTWWQCTSDMIARDFGNSPLKNRKPLVFESGTDDSITESNSLLKSETVTSGVPSGSISSVNGNFTCTTSNGRFGRASLINFTHVEGNTAYVHLRLYFSILAKSLSIINECPGMG